MSPPYIGFFELVEQLRAAAKPALRPVIEPGPIRPATEQFLAVDETAGITS